MKPVPEQLEYLLRATDRVVPRAELEALLELGRPLRVKLGVDPTAPDVTLGWAVVFDLLRRFQEMGHVAVLIIGDFTAQVGDPSGRSETRQRLTAAEVRGYADSCLEMLRPLLLEERLEIRYNSEWLGSMGMEDVLTLTSNVTVSRILEREDFANRLTANEPVSMIEMMYPLLQGYDSVAIEADIELGGADQLWNLLVGRDIQSRNGQQPQVAVTVPLLVGTDGTRKMSQSYGNYISVRDEPAEMFGKAMSIPDDAMESYFVLAARYREDEAADITRRVAAGELHPGDIKRRLAREIVAIYWGDDAAPEAEAAFDRVFREGETPEDVETFTIDDTDPVWLPGLLRDTGLVSSTSDGRRMIAQGAVKLDGERVEGEEIARGTLVGSVLQVGKRRFVELVNGS